MIIADTSVWVEFLRSNELIFLSLKSKIENGEVLALEWIFGELLQGARDRTESSRLHRYWESLPKTSHDGIWLEAGELSRKLGLPSQGVGLIDAAILVAGRRAKARIWTLDKKLLRLLRGSETFTM